MLLLLGAFIAGLLTVLAPCVLPLLPVIIGGAGGGTANGVVEEIHQLIQKIAKKLFWELLTA